MKMIHRGQSGLTLIELLIVIAILGIIAAVIIPNISGFITSGNVAAANTELENVKTAALGYFAANNNTWPETSDDLLEQGYISGTLKALYTFDAYTEGPENTFGWIVTAEPTDGGWSGIHWSEGATGPRGYHGKWLPGLPGTNSTP